MPYKILKNENFENLGGLNLKVSPYTQGPHEFLQLSNYEFPIPGAITKRPGSTQYLLAQTGFTPIQGLYEFVSLEGQSMIMYAQNGNMYFLQNSQRTTLMNGLQNTQTYFKTFVDRVFHADGKNIMKWNGLSGAFATGLTTGIGATLVYFSDYLYSLPQPLTASPVNLPVFSTPGIQPLLDSTGASPATFKVPSLLLTYSFGYVNERGFHGPATNVLYAGASLSQAFAYTLFFTTDSGSYLATNLTTRAGKFSLFGFAGNIENIPASYGVGYFGTSGITCSYSALTLFVGAGNLGLTQGPATAMCAVYRDNGPGTGRYRIGYAANTGTLGPASAVDTTALGFYDLNFPQSTFPEPTCIGASGFMPRYLEIYNNQMFFGGFSLFPSIVQFSDIGEPESVQPGSNFELRTNDGDRVTGFKTYLQSLVLFKQNSFHVLTGTDLTNFSIIEISDQYGCLSHNAAVVYETYLLFLDKKGIVRWNGANIEIISTKVESIFQQMNISAAYDKAEMIHYKNKNQIWCAIPINGSTVNNVIVVYDYLVGSWTRFDGLFPGQLAMCLADQPLAVPFYADYSGMIYNFGASYYGDNGRGITTIAQARFIADSGQSVQKIYRQLFLNSRAVNGGTLTFGVKFYNDFGTSVALGTTMVVSKFQNRIDFGLSVKSVSIEIDDFNSIDQQTIHGYALGSRFLRDT